MTTVGYNPDAANRAFLEQAGVYGPGCENEAEVTIFSVGLAEPGTMDAPFDDKECEKDSYTVWTFQVVHDGKVCFVRSRAQANTLANMGSKNLAWFNNLGLQPTDQDQHGNPAYNLDQLTGTKCCVRVSKPRQNREDPSVWYSGSVVDVFPVGGAQS
jgi:hypothetical protein